MARTRTLSRPLIGVSVAGVVLLAVVFGLRNMVTEWAVDHEGVFRSMTALTVDTVVLGASLLVFFLATVWAFSVLYLNAAVPSSAPQSPSES